jgi:EF-P beta-lysylation protein EpmB
MIPTRSSRAAWQDTLAQAVSDPSDLLARLELPSDLVSGQARNAFPLRVPEPFIARMRKGDPNDPLLAQVLPLAAESDSVAGYSTDPLGEAAARAGKGVVHKYQDRVLLIASSGCAINCRYCFRRHFPYQDNQISGRHWQDALRYIAADKELREVIFSGGDPLVTTDRRLSEMIRDLAEIPHLQRVRIHTRLPIVIPARITPELTEAMTATRLKPVMVLHSNHPQEIDESVGDAIKQLRQQGVTVLNQAVLLRGINDNVTTLTRLSESLFEFGVLPYYLFVLDRVAGAAHFDVPDEEAQALVGELQTCLPGYLVPRLAREIAGEPSKTLLTPLRRNRD